MTGRTPYRASNSLCGLKMRGCSVLSPIDVRFYAGTCVDCNDQRAYDRCSRCCATPSKWMKGAPFPEPSGELVGGSVGDKLYVFCGLGPGRIPQGLVYEYDPTANKWTKKSRWHYRPTMSPSLSWMGSSRRSAALFRPSQEHPPGCRSIMRGSMTPWQTAGRRCFDVVQTRVGGCRYGQREVLCNRRRSTTSRFRCAIRRHHRHACRDRVRYSMSVYLFERTL